MIAGSKSECSSLPTALVRDQKAILSLCTPECTVFSLFGWLNNHGNILSGLALTSPSNLLRSLHYHFLTCTNQVITEHIPQPLTYLVFTLRSAVCFPHIPFLAEQPAQPCFAPAHAKLPCWRMPAWCWLMSTALCPYIWDIFVQLFFLSVIITSTLAASKKKAIISEFSHLPESIW